MGLQIRVNVPTGQGEALLAGVRQGLRGAGELMLSASNALAPVEEGPPKHGIHMVETGRVQVEPGLDSDAVTIGYSAFWAVWEELDLTVHHPNGQAQFLSTGMLTTADAALEVVAERARAALAP